MMLELTFKKTVNVDIKSLYDGLIKYGDFTAYDAINESNLTNDDLTPEVMEQIFIALAQEALERKKAVSES
jgi:hypothetical protein